MDPAIPRPKIRYKKRQICKEDAYFDHIWSNTDTLIYSQEQITSIVTGFNNHVAATVLEHIDGVVLPLYMGVLIAGTYGKSNARDYAMTNTLGKRITHYNHHSDGYGGRIFYITTPTHNKWGAGRFWGFEPGRDFKEIFGVAYRADWKKYRNINNAREACDLFRKNKAREFGKEMTQLAMEQYDEFDFDIY